MTNLWQQLAYLCEFKNREKSPSRKNTSDFDALDSEAAKKLQDDYILFDMEFVQPDTENQKLFRDFKLSE